MFQGHWLSVVPEDYVLDVSSAQDNSLCLLLLTPSDSPMLIFGTPIFRGNYVIHDLAQNTIGFAPHTGSSKGAPQAGELPDNKVGGIHTSNAGEIWSWVIVAVLFIVFALLFAFVIYPAIRNWNFWGLLFFSLVYFGTILGVSTTVLQPVLESAINKIS
jgi:hypothetical protein